MKRIATISFVVILLGMTMGFSGKRTESQNWLDGDWSGVKYQVNMDKGWQMLLRIDAAAQVYEVTYPELGCTGQLELVSAEGNEAVFVEKLEGPCLTGGNIIVTKVGDKFLSFTCLRDAEQRLASYCTLKKVSI